MGSAEPKTPTPMPRAPMISSSSTSTMRPTSSAWSTSPTSPMTLSTAALGTKSRRWGPRMTPATISPTSAGFPTAVAALPATQTMMTKITVKKMTLKWWNSPPWWPPWSSPWSSPWQGPWSSSPWSSLAP